MGREEEQEIICDPQERIDDAEERKPEPQLSGKERIWIALGALKSALLIGLVYMGVLGGLIWLMLKLWR